VPILSDMSQDRRKIPREKMDRRRQATRGGSGVGWLAVAVIALVAFMLIWTEVPA